MRYDDHPVQPLKLASELEKDLGSVIIKGADFQKVLSSKRLRIQVLTILDRLVIEDINLLSVVAVQEVLRSDQCLTAKNVERGSSLEYSTSEDSVAEDSTPGQGINSTSIPTEKSSENGENPLSGRWFSLTSNTQRQLMQDGDYLYGTYEVEGASGTYDFKKQGDGTYSGFTSSVVKMWYQESGNSRKIFVDCPLKEETVLTVISDRRIEGKMGSIPLPENSRKQIKYVKTCGKSEEKRREWQEFVWVRQD